MNVALAWTATSLAGSFGRYELSRTNPDGVVWPIAYIETEATVSYTDREYRPGAVETYEIQARHTNGTISPVATDTASPAAGQSWRLASNAETIDLAILPNQGAQASFPRDTSVQDRLGRRFPTAVTLPYDRGFQMAATLDLRPLASEQMVALFDQVRALPGVELALTNPFGERWWGFVQFAGGPLTIENFTQADVMFTQSADHPTPVVA